MDKIHKYPPSLVLLSALIGGTIGAISVYVALIYDPNGPGGHSGFEPYLFGCFWGAISGVVLGIVSGMIGYAIKPRVWASVMGGALGGVLSPILLWTFYALRADLINLNEARTVNRLEQMYPEPKPIPALSATFQELTSGEFKGSCAVSSDGSRLALGSEDRITLWDLNEHKQIGEFLSDYGLPVALSPDGRILAFDDISHNDFILRDMQTGEQIAQLGDVYDTVAFSPDGRLLAVRPAVGSARINLIDPSTGKQVGRIEGPQGFGRMTFNPDGKLLAVSNLSDQITIWDTTTLKLVEKLKGTGGVIFWLAFSPDGSKLATGISFPELDEDGIEVWDVNTRTRLAATRAPGSMFIAFSSDGRTIMTYGNRDSDLYFWDANSLEPLGSVNGPPAFKSELFFLPDGRVLACYLPSQIGIWTIESP
jgi:WD40 repeat protein